MQEQKQAELKSFLNGLAEKNIISSEQVTAILDKTAQQEADRQAQMEAMQNMTQEERDAARQADKTENNKPETNDVYTQLVKDGTITQEQADAIHTARRAKMDEQKQAELTKALDNLVEKSVIDSSQAAAIQTKIKEAEAARQTQMEATKDMTQEEREAYCQQNPPVKIDPIAELVEAGTLTQAQADEVSKALPFIGGGKDNHQGAGPDNHKGPGNGNGPKNMGSHPQGAK